MEPSGDVLAACLDDEPFDVEEQILVGPVVLDVANRVLRHAVQRLAQRVRVGGRYNSLSGEHHEVRVVDRHHRRQQKRLGVLEVFVQDERDVLGRELHQCEYIGEPQRARR